MSQIGFVWVWLRLWERTDGSMQRVKKWRAVARVLVLLLLCGFMTVSAVTRLEEPVFTQVYYAQNNDRQEHVVYFYIIHNVENQWGEPFRFCFPEEPAIPCKLQPVEEYGQYSTLMEQDGHKWQQGKRIFGRYCVELLELRFVVTEDDLQNGALHLTQGKVYFQGGYYQNLDLGDVLISAAGTVVDDSAVPRHSMAYISIGEFSERPYFSDFGQVWAYLQANLSMDMD